MRQPVLPGDISAVARALLAAPPPARMELCGRIFAAARAGAAYMARTRALHPRWGDGSLSAAARRFQLADEPFLDQPEYLACTRMVLRALHAELTASAATPAR